MGQLTLNIIQESEVKVIASSAFNFRIELVNQLGNKSRKPIENGDVITFTPDEEWVAEMDEEMEHETLRTSKRLLNQDLAVTRVYFINKRNSDIQYIENPTLEKPLARCSKDSPP